MTALVLVDIVANPARRGGQRIARFMTNHQDGFATLGEAADAVAAFYPERPRPKTVADMRKNLRLRADCRFGWPWDPAFRRSPDFRAPRICWMGVPDVAIR
jgi:hypothetical protein